MIYDEEKLSQLEGEVCATAFRLGKVAQPVQQRLQADLDAFNVLTATQDQARHIRDLETLLSVMQQYAEAADAYTSQLQTNLRETVERAQQEKTRSAFHLRQFQLLHLELMEEKKMTTKWLDVIQLHGKGGKS